ncbi:FAD-binding oxidoreductase [Saccharopolyspora sp. NPDC050642]|uniref:FAD-binding oxidoreductase n=1 Tax=Saccharopolyspora sp. NPDC050642 TaxID=3157099 RepID=UPI0033F4F156
MTGLAELRSIVGAAGLLPPDADLRRYEIAPNLLTGAAAFLVRPSTVDEVRAVLAWARENATRLVVQGANSGLVGAGLPDASGGWGVLSTERLREPFSVDPRARTLTAGAGWRLDEINERLAEHSLQLPVEVGSSPSVGGMVATNTAGSHVIRYGDVRRRLLGVQAVVPDDRGTVFDRLKPLRKCNEGLDVSQLFVGTGGEYGVVTAASVELAPLPRSRAAAWLAVEEDRMPDVLNVFEHSCAEWLSACEVASPSALALLADRHGALLRRVPSPQHHAMLVEVGAPDGSAEERLLAVLADLDERGWLIGAQVGGPAEMWQVRHTIPEITERMSPVWSFDVSTPRSEIAAFRRDVLARLAARHPEITPIELGHYGDGGLHLILPLPVQVAADPDAVDGVRRLVYDTAVRDHGGTFSAEHGIGPKNADMYRRYVSEDVRELSAALKRRFDPDGILGWSLSSPDRVSR